MTDTDATRITRIGVIGLFALVAPLLAWAQPEASEKANPPAAEPVAAAQPGNAPTIRPRLELSISSVSKLLREADRSRAGIFAAYYAAILQEVSSASAEGISADEARAVLDQMLQWPDSGVAGVTFAADREGRPRWALRLNWPLADLHKRVTALLASEAATEVFNDISVAAAEDGVYVVRLPDVTLAYLLAAGEDHSLIASHPDIPFPAAPFAGSVETEADGPSLLACRLNLTGTEADSGATLFSSFSFLTCVDYAARVNEAGEWVEGVNVHWPPLSGMAVKALLGKVKQSYFVPEDAFGALAYSTSMAPSVLEGLAGFGVQVMMDAPGEIAVVGDGGAGPIARRAREDGCIAILPGEGFLPAPDVIVQTRISKADTFVDDARQAVNRINEMFRERERPEPWHETVIRDRTVFWNDGSTDAPGFLLPLVMRNVVFVNTERDADDKERDYLVMGWTSTSPEQLARRWVDLPRRTERRFLPSDRATNGQMWVNWKQIYRWALPYLNVSLSVVSHEALLPGIREVSESLTDGLITAKVQYAGLKLAHQGPLPVGIIALPSMLTTSLALDESSGSDLARERMAAERLKVFYHHARLFNQDLGRWPAELGELDGYIDFAGHPELLRLDLSSRARWNEWFTKLFEAEDVEDDEAEDVLPNIDDDLFVIDWSRERWTLGIAPGKLEHLTELYIDQDGNIHRTEKPGESKEAEEGPEEPAKVESESS